MGPSIDQQIAALKAAEKRQRRAVKLRAQGKTLQEIADDLGISHQRVSQILKRAELENAGG